MRHVLVMRGRVFIALTALLAGCAYTATPSEELRDKPPIEDFVINADIACVFEKTTAHVATIVQGLDRHYRGFLREDRKTGWLRSPLVLLDLESVPSGTRVRRYSVSPDIEFANGKDFADRMKQVACPAKS